jgi:hypothetical protein
MLLAVREQDYSWNAILWRMAGTVMVYPTQEASLWVGLQVAGTVLREPVVLVV